MLAELEAIAQAKAGECGDDFAGAGVVRRLCTGCWVKTAKRGQDELLSRLHVFTQDALAPLKMASSLSFVRDFERLLGDAFFRAGRKALRRCGRTRRI